MQEENASKHSTKDVLGVGQLSVPTVAFHPQNVLCAKGSTRRCDEKRTDEDAAFSYTDGQKVVGRDGLLSQISSSTDVGSFAVDQLCVSSGRGTDDMSENGQGVWTGSYTAEQGSFTGKSIRDRIAALSAAAGVSGLGSSPVREKIKNTLIKAVSASSPSICDKTTNEDEQTTVVTETIINKEEKVESVTIEKGVAFDVEFGKATENYVPARFLSTVGRNNGGGEGENTTTQSPVVGVAHGLKQKGVAFDVDFGKAIANRPPAQFLSKRGCYKLGGNSENNTTETPVVGEAHGLKEKGVCPRSQTPLVQSPFGVHKKPAKAKNHPAVLSEPPEHFKGNLLHDQAIRKDVEHQEDCGPHEPSSGTSLKRSSYAINTLSSAIDCATKEGMTVADVLRDAGDVEDCTQRLPHSNHDTTCLPNETHDKRNTFILDDEATEGAEQMTKASQKRNTFNLDSILKPVENGSGNDLSIPGKPREVTTEDDSKQKYFQSDFGIKQSIDTALKRNTFSLDTASNFVENDVIELPVTGLLDNLPTGDCQQRASQTSWQSSDASEKRNTFTLDTVSQCIDNAVSRELPVTGVLHTMAKEEGKIPKTFQLDSGTLSQATDTSQKRNTFTLDNVSKLIENTISNELSVPSVFHDLANQVDNKQETLQSEFGIPHQPSDTSQKRNTFTLDTVSSSLDDAISCDLAVSGVLNDLANEEESKQKSVQSELETLHQPRDTSQKRNTFTLDTVSQSIDNAIRSDLSVSLSILNDLGNEEDSKQNSSQPDFNASQQKGGVSQKRNTFTLDTVSSSLDSAISCDLAVSSVLNDLANEEDSKQKTLQSELETPHQPSDTSQKRKTFTLDTVSHSIDNAINSEFSVGFVLDSSANEEDCKQKESQVDFGAPWQTTDVSHKRNTFILDSLSPSVENSVGSELPVTGLQQDLATGEDNKQKLLQSDTRTPRLDTVSHSVENEISSELSVGNVFHDLATEEDSKANTLQLDFETHPQTSYKLKELSDTFSLVTASQSLENAIEKGLQGSEKDTKKEVKSTPYQLESAPEARLCSKEKREVSTSEEKREPSGKLSTFALDSVSLSLQSGTNESLPPVDVPSRLSKEAGPRSCASDQLQDSNSDSAVSEKRGTFTLEAVSCTLDDAQQRGLPVVDVLDRLASEHAIQPFISSSEESLPAKVSQNRGTYTLDTVSHAIEEAVEKGVPVSETLNQIAQEEEKTGHLAVGSVQNISRAVMLARGSSPTEQDRGLDEIETSFEDALEQLEDCETFDDDESHSPFFNRPPSFSLTPDNRGTSRLDVVSKSLQDSAKEGVPAVKTLERLPTAPSYQKDSDGKRRTYTLDDVSLSLKTASERGIPVVEALENISRTKDATAESTKSRKKRGTYTLEEVSQSLEHAKKTGIPVIETLEVLSRKKSKGSLRLKMPEKIAGNRGTYTLDKVSHTLERAKEKGIPVVEALGHVTGPAEPYLEPTSDALYRRQKKLTNRKTYALASPLETIGEGRKLRLYDGSQRRMLSPVSFHMKSQEVSSENTKSESKSRGLGVVQKLDFLTSACEILLETTAKEAARDRERVSSAPAENREDSMNAETLRRSRVRSMTETVGKSGGDDNSNAGFVQSHRNTFTLQNVSLTLDDAKTAGIPVVDTLHNLSAGVLQKASAPSRTNLMRLNSKSDSELSNGGDGNQSAERHTHSLDDVSRTLDDAKKAGIPVIQALEELTNELAEFSRTAMNSNAQKVLLDNEGNLNENETPRVDVNTPNSDRLTCSTPYPPPVRKAYSLDDIALAVKRAFRSGTSLDDILGEIPHEPARLVSSSRDVRPRSVDSGFLSALSDFDVSQSFESPRHRSNTYITDSSNEDLDQRKSGDQFAKKCSPDLESQPLASTTQQEAENRRTFTLDHVGCSVDSALMRGVPVVETLKELLDLTAQQKDNVEQLQTNQESMQVTMATSTMESPPSFDACCSSERKKPTKPKRYGLSKPKSLQSNSESFVIEYFSSPSEKEPSKFKIGDDGVETVLSEEDTPGSIENDKSNLHEKEKVGQTAASPSRVLLDKNTVDANLITVEQKAMGLSAASNDGPPRARATWRASGSVLDKISGLMNAAEDCELSAVDVLNDAAQLPSESEGEIEDSPKSQPLPQPDTVEEEAPAMTSQQAYLLMQLNEKRRLIEAEKMRAQKQSEEERRKLCETVFWYVIHKSQGGQEFEERSGTQAGTRFQGQLQTPEPELSDQPSPPIAWSSPAPSPLPTTPARQSTTPRGQLCDTREFRLSEYPPTNGHNLVRPSSEPVVDVPSLEPEAFHPTTRKCWDVSPAQSSTPSPFVRPETGDDVKASHVKPAVAGRVPEIEVEVETPSRKGLAMFIGDDAQPTTQVMTPEQEKKREKFMRLRQKKLEEERTRKEAELEKKRRKEEKLREKEQQLKMEERLRLEEVERQKSEQEWRVREASETQVPGVPDSYATYRAGPRKPSYCSGDDGNSYFVLGPTQSSGFAEFSGPQCYVKPSGKSNRKIIINAVSHVCLSGTVNQEQKEKCLQAISESDGHHFMILFKDGLKFRGLYVHNLENDQLYKIFGIGPRLIMGKMVETLYKYNSGGKEFVKIPSKTVSISVDGFAIQKSCWQSSKPTVQSKTSSNLKRPPRPPQR